MDEFSQYVYDVDGVYTWKEANDQRSLCSDRMIKIFVGEQTPRTQPFLIQQALLKHASEYFTKAFRHEALGDQTEPGTLRFPEDDLAAWKVFFYWLIKRSLPAQDILIPLIGTSYDHMLAVRCWALGDKYYVPLFQDLVMLELLRTVEYGTVTEEAIKEAFFNTPPGSRLQDLMAEELIYRVRNRTTRHEELDVFNGIPGFAAILMRKSDEHRGSAPIVGRVSRMVGDKWRSSTRWRAYLVGEGPEQHWVYHGQPVAEGTMPT